MRNQIIGTGSNIEVKCLLEGTANPCCKLLTPIFNRAAYIGKSLTFSSDTNAALLDKIQSKQNFHIREKADPDLNLQSELGQGIIAPQDSVNKAAAEKLAGSVKVGDGIFVLSHDEVRAKSFTKAEMELIKPYFTTDQLSKYYGAQKNSHWILYTKSDIIKPDKQTKVIPITTLPNIKRHLDTFTKVITSDYAPYGLHRAREQYFFEGAKIVVTRKCPEHPIFTYTEFDCYVSQTFNIIKSDRIDLKYLTGLLNSKLVAFWLRNKGKMQGSSYQLDKKPLLEIPIYKPGAREMNEISYIVDAIIALKKKAQDWSTQEQSLNELVYSLYGLNSDDIKIIESI